MPILPRLSESPEYVNCPTHQNPLSSRREWLKGAGGVVLGGWLSAPLTSNSSSIFAAVHDPSTVVPSAPTTSKVASGKVGEPPIHGRFLYAACPGIRNYLDYGGHGLLVFDRDRGHQFVKRIPLQGLDHNGQPSNVKGICASASTGLLHVSTIHTLQCVDLQKETVLWESEFATGCDRMSISPDGKVMYLPSFEKEDWYVLNAVTGERIATVSPKSRAHNTVYGADGKECYLAGLGSPSLTVVDCRSHTIDRTIGPFTNNIRPFTINGAQTRVFACINDLLGFEIGDLQSGKRLHRVEVQGFEKGPVKRHGCPSHGIGLTPDESELWVCDAHNRKLHLFDATVMPPRQMISLDCRDEPGWITFSIDGKTAWPSTGDVIDVASRKTVAQLTDETGAAVSSEKLLEVIWDAGKVKQAGNQFGVGQKSRATPQPR